MQGNAPLGNPPANFDTAWKEVLSQYFEAFLAFCFPPVHALIDWSHSPEALDKEMEQIAKDAESGKRIADKLFKVWLRDGRDIWVLVHVEVQSQPDPDFSKRIYQYNYRAFDLYEQPVISLAVLGDEQDNWRPSFYGYALAGCEASLKFLTVKLIDYETQWQQLETSTNPFTLMIMAHLKTKATQGQPQQRQQWKWSLIRTLFERGYNQEDIRQLFRAVDWMMTLPEELQQGFETQVTRYQEERTMPLLSHMEIRAEKRGMEQGMERGSLLNAREWVIELLEIRFDSVPAEIADIINQIEDRAKLQQLHRQAATVESMEAFQQFLSQDSEESPPND